MVYCSYKKGRSGDLETENFCGGREGEVAGTTTLRVYLCILAHIHAFNDKFSRGADQLNILPSSCPPP